MNRYQSTRRDRAATLTASLILVAAVITGVVVLLHKIAVHVRASIEEAPVQQDAPTARVHDMAAILGALAQSPLFWGLALCLAGAVVIEETRRRG